MRHLLLPAALGAFLFLSSWSLAQEPAPMPKPEPLPNPAPAALPPPCAGGSQTEKTICLPKVLLVEEQQAITVPVMRLRDQVVGRDVVHKMEVTYVEEKHTVTEMKTVPREVEQQVCVTKMVPQTSVDCTGKPCTIYVKVPETKTVKITVFDVVPVQREVIVKMPCLKPVDVEVEVHKLCVDETEEAAILKRWHLNITPNEIKVMLPACPLPWLH
jgi:hypothetical protein